MQTPSPPAAADLFHGISEQEAQKVSRCFTERRYRKGERIFSRGEPADSLMIVKEGQVRIVSLSGKGAEMILNILSAGAIFGELLLSEDKRPFSAVAGTDTLVDVISKRGLLEIFSAVPAVSRNFILLLSGRLAKMEKEFAEFGHTWSYHRLSRVLLKLCVEHGQETPKGTAIRLHLTHEDLANLIGTTRETVSTQMSRLRRMGMVKRQDGFLVVDRKRLEEFSRSEETKYRGTGS